MPYPPLAAEGCPPAGGGACPYPPVDDVAADGDPPDEFGDAVEGVGGVPPCPDEVGVTPDNPAEAPDDAGAPVDTGEPPAGAGEAPPEECGAPPLIGDEPPD